MLFMAQRDFPFNGLEDSLAVLGKLKQPFNLLSLQLRSMLVTVDCDNHQSEAEEQGNTCCLRLRTAESMACASISCWDALWLDCPSSDAIRSVTPLADISAVLWRSTA